MAKTKAYCLCFNNEDIGDYVPSLDHVFYSLKSARIERIKIIKKAKSDDSVVCDWDFWWSVSYPVKPASKASKTEEVRGWYHNPTSRIGIIIEEVEINE